jgi:hypothetical protein
VIKPTDGETVVAAARTAPASVPYRTYPSQANHNGLKVPNVLGDVKRYFWHFFSL